MSGAVPPDTVTGKVYATPTEPAGRTVPTVILGRGLTAIEVVALWFKSALLVAFTVAVKAVATVEGALNVVADVVLPVSDPPPDTVHATPALATSLATVAERAAVCPASILAAALVMETAIGELMMVMVTAAEETVTGVVAESVTDRVNV